MKHGAMPTTLPAETNLRRPLRLLLGLVHVHRAFPCFLRADAFPMRVFCATAVTYDAGKYGIQVVETSCGGSFVGGISTSVVVGNKWCRPEAAATAVLGCSVAGVCRAVDDVTRYVLVVRERFHGHRSR